MLPTLLAMLVLGAPLYEMDEAALDAYVTGQASAADFNARLHAVARDSLGTAYADGPLGEGPGAAYDPDPLIDMTRVDCVTYVEQCVALAAGDNYASSFDLLQKIRYAGGAINYETRNHFLVSDWTENNDFCVDVTSYLCVPTTEIKRTISKRGFFERVDAPGLGASEADREISLQVIAPEEVAAAEEHLPDTALVVFVGKVDWLFALHCGFYLRDDSGSGKLYHASSKAGKVVAVDLQEYLRDQSDRYAGITVYRIDQPTTEK